jgi:hypothetical protein
MGSASLSVDPPPDRDPLSLRREAGRAARRGSVLLSLRRDHWRFRVGEDLSIGYSHHDRESAHFYLEETIDFEAVTPEAAVWLRP